MKSIVSKEPVTLRTEGGSPKGRPITFQTRGGRQLFDGPGYEGESSNSSEESTGGGGGGWWRKKGGEKKKTTQKNKDSEKNVHPAQNWGEMKTLPKTKRREHACT